MPPPSARASGRPWPSWRTSCSARCWRSRSPSPNSSGQMEEIVRTLAKVASNAATQSQHTSGSVASLAQAVGQIGAVVKPDLHHRRPDQPSGPQRRHRGRPGRRGRPRLRGGRGRGEAAGDPDRPGDARRLDPDREHAGGGQALGRRDRPDQGDGRPNLRQRRCRAHEPRVSTPCSRSPPASRPPRRA